MGADEEAPACLYDDVSSGGGKNIVGQGWGKEEEGSTSERQSTLQRSTGGQTGKNVRETLSGFIFFPLKINLKVKMTFIWLLEVNKMFLYNTNYTNMQTVFTLHYLIKEKLGKPFFIFRISVAAFCCALLVEIL